MSDKVLKQVNKQWEPRLFSIYQWDDWEMKEMNNSEKVIENDVNRMKCENEMSTVAWNEKKIYEQNNNK